MKDRFFLDTNLFVYSFDRNAPAKAKRASDLIADAVTSRKGIVSYQVVQEFLNVALKRFERPMKPPEAEQYLTTVFLAAPERLRFPRSVPGSFAAVRQIPPWLV